MANDQDQVSGQQNVARQIGAIAAALSNAAPAATATSSPKAWGFNAISTTGTTLVLSNSTMRHGVLFHVPSTTAQVLVFPSNIATVPTTNAPGGALMIVGLGTEILPSTVFPNVNCSWSALGLNGSTLPLTVWEFF